MRKKILLIIVDQMRADCLNGALADHVDMPNIRELMNHGVTFNRHYTNTVPCGPARASLLTGLYAMNHRSINNGTPLSREHPTIASEIRKARMHPLLFGYSDTSIDPTGLHKNDPALCTEEGVASGFEEIVRMRFQDSASWLGYLAQNNYELPDNYWQIYKPVAAGGSSEPGIRDPALYKAEHSDTAFLTDQTLRELYGREKLDWFSALTYIRPHPPLVAPAPFNQMYPPENVPAPVCPHSIEDQKASHTFHNSYFSKPSIPYLYIGFDGRIDKITAETAAQLRAVYFGLISELDQHIGRIIDYLRDTGQFDNTMIIFTADHGEMLGDHNMWGKNTPYNASFQIPLIICDPRNKQNSGRQVDAYSESIDIAPTLLEWVGLDSPPGFNGRSLLPWLEGQTPTDWRDHMFAEMDMGDRTHYNHYQDQTQISESESSLAILQDEKFKLVYFNGDVPPLLFDISADPHEAYNLADDPQHQTILISMIRKMLDHRMTHAHHALSRLKLTSNGVKMR